VRIESQSLGKIKMHASEIDGTLTIEGASDVVVEINGETVHLVKLLNGFCRLIGSH